jgi:XTP/dITP diphosphohydrolase
MKTLLLATANRHKVDELAALLTDLPVRLVALPEVAPGLELPETGTTFRANAQQKALTAAVATGLLTLADDSGLAVDALDGAPGIYSSRFAPTDDERIAKLLELLTDVPATQRTARFHCALVVATPAGILANIKETAEGTILTAPRGVQGFGYDPIFLPAGEHRSMAELSQAEKNVISHRGKALRHAVTFLRDYLARQSEGTESCVTAE